MLYSTDDVCRLLRIGKKKCLTLFHSDEFPSIKIGRKFWVKCDCEEIQLRDFNHLNKDGIFEKIPEYPEFAWLEGITNAVTHRNYAMQGEHIKIFIFDD